MQLPADVQANVVRWNGAAGRAWLEKLPDLDEGRDSAPSLALARVLNTARVVA